jgi:hypothetical protein
MSQSAAFEFRLSSARGVVGAGRRLLLEKRDVTGCFTDPVAALHSAARPDCGDSAARGAHMSVGDALEPMSLETAPPLYERSNCSR